MSLFARKIADKSPLQRALDKMTEVSTPHLCGEHHAPSLPPSDPSPDSLWNRPQAQASMGKERFK